MGFYDAFHILHATVRDLNCIFVNQFVITVALRKVFLYQAEKFTPYVCFHCGGVWWVKPQYFPLSRRLCFTVMGVFIVFEVACRISTYGEGLLVVRFG